MVKALVENISSYYNVQTEEWSFVLGNVPICLNAFILLSGISRYHVKLAQHHVVNGSTPFHGNLLRDYKAVRSLSIRCWLNCFSKVNGDHQPDSDQVHLPPNFSKFEIFEAFTEAMNSMGIEPISFSSFSHVWRKEFPFLKIRKQIRLGKCDLCEELEYKKAEAKGAKARRQYQDAKRIHIAEHTAERNFLGNLVHGALIQESSCPTTLLLITDWMSPMRLPHFPSLPKSCFTKIRPKMQVFGLVNWTSSERYYATHFDWWPHDSNLHISLLFSHIRERLEQYPSQKTLILSTDNCGKDNKNKVFFAFCAERIFLIKKLY